MRIAGQWKQVRQGQWRTSILEELNILAHLLLLLLLLKSALNVFTVNWKIKV